MNTFKNIYYMTSHIFLLLFMYLFIPHRYTKRKTLCICALSFVLLTASDILKLNIFSDSDLCYALATIFQIVLVQSVSLFIARRRNSRILFLGLSASNYVIAGSLASSALYIYTDNAPVSLSGGFLIHIVILAILYAKTRDIFLKSCERETTRSWLGLCFIPVFFYLGFSFLAFFPYTFEDHPESIPSAVFFLITMFVSYVVVLRYLENELSSADIYWKNALFEAQIKSLEDQYRLIEQSAQSMRILRHDMRHYSGMIDSFLAQKEYDKIRELTRHLNETSQEHTLTTYCQNIIINSILSDMMEKAHNLDVNVHLDVLVPNELPVNHFELASTVANLFENALACAKELPKAKRQIDVRIHCGADHLLIEISNEYEKAIDFDSLTGLPKSARGKKHGFGILSVSAFTEKIGGQLGCYCENNHFRVLIAAKF